MRIVTDTVAARGMRYATAGDYWADPDGTIRIQVADTGDDRMNFLVALHELVEFTLCRHRGIEEPAIMAFDLAHPDSDDPGFEPGAPYGREHAFATSIEMLLADQLGVNWKEYNAVISGLDYSDPVQPGD